MRISPLKSSVTVFSMLVLLCISLSVQAQVERTYHWAFPGFNGLDFSSGSPVADTSEVPNCSSPSNPQPKGTSAMSDVDGNLEFYSNGRDVWDATHNVMQGGGNLEGECSSSQSSLIVPNPFLPGRYYLFVVGLQGGDTMQYYTIDMALNGGLGAVLPIPPTVLLDSATEQLCATKHANDRDYWVLTHKWQSDEFHAFLVDPSGVNATPVISSVGITLSGSPSETGGQMKLSPDGTKLATARPNSGTVQLFDFNAETGVVSNPITLFSGVSSLFPYGVEFSDDSKKLYISRRDNTPTLDKIYQFDLDHISDECLIGSETVIAGPGSFPFRIPGDMQLASDRKIYITSYDGGFVDSLDVINKPWLKGAESEFEEAVTETEYPLNIGLTNFVSTYLNDGIRMVFGTNCENDSTAFFPEDTLGVDSVSWNFGDPTSGANNTSNLVFASHIFSSPDTFTITLLSYKAGVADTFTKDIIIWDLPEKLLVNDTTLCTGESITLDASYMQACHLWSDSSTNSTLNVSSQGEYTVEVFHQSCVFRDTVFVAYDSLPPQFTLGNDTLVCSVVSFIIDPNLPNLFYTWQDGSNDTTFQVTSTGQYWLSVTNSCGATVDTLNVELDSTSQPVLNFPDDTIACSTVPFTISFNFNNATYLWNDNGTQSSRTLSTPGTYWVEITTNCGTVADTFDLSFVSPLISSLPDENVLCPGNDSLLLEPFEQDAEVLWNSAFVGDSLWVKTPGPYWLEAENTCGIVRDTVFIVNYDTSYRLDLGPDQNICPEDTAFVSVQNGLFPFNYQWSSGSDSTGIETRNTGTLVLTASNRCATISGTVQVNVSPFLKIQEPETRSVCENQPVKLIPDEGAVAAFWNFNDSSDTFTATNAGVISVQLEDAFGCLFSDSIALNDSCPELVFVPNVLTPNGDGVNDELCVETENITSIELIIYNRWGTEVHASSGGPACWDGRLNGKLVPAGTYFYIVLAEGLSGNTTSYRGSITLFQ